MELNSPSFLTTLLLLTAPAVAQTVGGGNELLYQWNGDAEADWFGVKVSDAGDVNQDGYSDIIAAAPVADNGGRIDVGRVNVYSGADGSLLHQWHGSNDHDEFGWSVASAGDVNGDGNPDLIVGATGADPGGLSHAGSAFVYSGADGSLLYQWHGERAQGFLGNSVSGAGDVNHDGYDDVIIGVPGDYSGTQWGAGKAFVYSGIDGSLLYEWMGEFDDGLGSSVSGAGDVNGDGYPDLVVGANTASRGALTGAGLVKVYSGVDGSQLHEWFGARDFEYFGNCVSNAGDVNGDGYADLIVGAPKASSALHHKSGGASVYSGVDGTLLYQWYGADRDNSFGSSVSNAGDVNGDGFDDLIVGASKSSSEGHSWAGSAHLYSGADGSLIQQWNGADGSDLFGQSVSGGGDVNHDGFADVIVGASNADPNGIATGSVYVYSTNPYLRASASSIFASAGGVINLELSFPESAALGKYRVLISTSGIGPTFYGVDIPLTLDGLVIDSYTGNYPFPTHSGLQGTLNAVGKSDGIINLSAGLPASLIGSTFRLAAIAGPQNNAPEHSSTAVAITILP